MDELLKIIGEKEVEIHILRKHIANVEEQVKQLQIELENSPKMELISVKKEKPAPIKNK